MNNAKKIKNLMQIHLQNFSTLLISNSYSQFNLMGLNYLLAKCEKLANINIGVIT